MKKYTNRLIKETVCSIVEKFNPEKIILFGSYARGTAGSESDVDLCNCDAENNFHAYFT